MAEKSGKFWISGQGRVSALLPCSILLFFCSSLALGADWYLNDAETGGDCVTKAAGNDKTGDGTAAKPFRSLRQALLSAKKGDTLRLDTGDYVVPSIGAGPGEIEVFPITLSGLTIEGAGPGKTRLHACGKAGLAFSEASGNQLREFSITGGDSSLSLEGCSGFVITRVRTEESLAYGILLVDSQRSKIEQCTTAKSGFRGLQLRRSNHNTLSGNIAKNNVNSGFCLEASSENKFTGCESLNNGSSGFFVFRNSDNNRLEKCVSQKNEFVGFYADSGSSLNRFLENTSRWNERGFTLNGAPGSVLQGNVAESNKSFGFWIKNKSEGVKAEDNKAFLNGTGFMFSADSPPALLGNNRSEKNKLPDQFVPAETRLPGPES